MNPSKLAFSRLTLYNPKKLFPLQTLNEWCSSTPNVPSGCSDDKPKRFGVGVSYVQFANVINEDYDNLSFWVANVHYPLAHADKLYTSRYFASRISKIAKNEILVMVGDFNTFDEESPEQLNILKETMHEATEHIDCTFTTFPHDQFAIINNKLMHSKLDHVFIYPKYGNYILNTDVISTLENRISDHYALSCVLTINK